MRAVALLVFLCSGGLASSALAAVGVIPTIVQGFDETTADARRRQLDFNVEETLGASYVALELKAGCEISLDPKCIAAAAANSKVDIDEVAQVVLLRTGPKVTEMRLRIFRRDGELQQELRERISDAEAVDATTALLLKAFDPPNYRGVLSLTAPEGAVLLVDGLPLERQRVHLRVGAHVLEVAHPGGRVETIPFEVAFGETTELLVPAAPPIEAGGAPFWVAGGTAAAGILAVSGGVVLYFVADHNRSQWSRRAVGITFPNANEDPLCAADDACGARDGWTRGYGPLGTRGQVGQGARFMMVAFSRENEDRWESATFGAIGLGIAGALATIGGIVGVVALLPAGEPTDTVAE